MALNEHRLLNIPSNFNVNNGIQFRLVNIPGKRAQTFEYTFKTSMWIMALNNIERAQTFEYTFPLQFNVNNGIKRAQTFEYTFPLQCE